MVVLVLPQMLGEVADPPAEQGNLDLGRSGVAVMSAELSDCLLGRFHLSCSDPRVSRTAHQGRGLEQQYSTAAGRAGPRRPERSPDLRRRREPQEAGPSGRSAGVGRDTEPRRS